MTDLSKLEKFVEAKGLTSVGRLCVILFVTDKLEQLAYPYSVDELLSANQGQIRGLSGSSVSSIMRKANITLSSHVFGEGGRTNRGSVRSAREYVSWINENYSYEDIQAGLVFHFRDFLAARILDLVAADGRIYNSIPTADPKYIGPRFVFSKDGLSLDNGKSSLDDDIPAEIVAEIRRVVADLIADLQIAGNSYGALREALSRYNDEVSREADSLRIPIIYARGLEIENYADALDKADAEDPPLNSSRDAAVKSLRSLNGLLVASTKTGRGLLSAAATYNAHEVDMRQFGEVATSLTERARAVDLIDRDASDFLVSLTTKIYAISNLARRAHIGLLGVRNAWSSIIRDVVIYVLVKFSENSSYVTEFYSSGGHILDVAIGFFLENLQVFELLAILAPEFFAWLPPLILWIRANKYLE